MSTLRAGTGRAIITPPVGMPMGGWSNALHERSDGNDIDLTATVLVVTDGNAAAAICEMDLCIITDAQAQAIREAITAATPIPLEATRVTATHNHSAPVTGELTGGGWMREGLESVEPYMTMVVELVAGAAREAWANMRPVTIGHGRGASPLAVNRRMTLPGIGIRVGHAWDGPTDPTVRVARLDGEDGRAVATIVHYSAHPTILAGGNRFINPDYPGHVRRVVEWSLGGHCLFLQGTPGDIGPSESFVDDLEPYQRLGTMLGHDAAATAHRSTARHVRQRNADHQDPSTWLTFFEYEPQPAADSTLRVERRTIDMPLREDLGDATELRSQHARLRSELIAAIDRAAEPMEIRELRVQTKGASMRAERAEAIGGKATHQMELHGLRIGPISLVGIPMEPFIELGLEIEARSPAPMTLVSGYTNGYRNYLPTEAEFAKGGYEVDIAPFQPEAAGLYVDASAGLLEALAD